MISTVPFERLHRWQSLGWGREISAWGVSGGDVQVGAQSGLGWRGKGLGVQRKGPG